MSSPSSATPRASRLAGAVEPAPANLTLPLDQLPDPLPIPTLPGAFDATVRPPGSKSITNRLVLLAALARGRSRLRDPLTGADDTERMIDAVTTLGATVQRDGADLLVRGVGGRWPARDATISLNNAGTATRFLTAAAALAAGPVTIDGNERMRMRPIGDLTAALTTLGLRVEHIGRPGCPPLRIHPVALPPEADLTVRADTSSQFVSALLHLGPFLERGITIRIEGAIASEPYVRMTLELLGRAGAQVRHADDLRVIRIGPGESGRGLEAFDLTVEPDASGATYFWAAAAITPGATARVSGLGPQSVQGDTDFIALLARMGARVERADDALACRGPTELRPVLADMAPMPDAAMTLAVCACFASGTSILQGLGTLRVKETDRIEALRRELTKLGVAIENPVRGDPNAMTITPPDGGLDCSPDAPRVEFDTYDDHRMAMSLALVGLRRPNVFIRNPRCVEKTYPTFWRDLAKLYA